MFVYVNIFFYFCIKFNIMIDLDKVIFTIKNLIKNSKFENHTYAVGGCVRDKILGHPIKDIDLVVDLLDGGVEFADWMCETHKDICKNRCTYPTFGTAKFTIVIDGVDYDIETVMTRSEQYHDKNSRKPECDFGSLKEDCYRRDLTINSLYLNISNGEILDLTAHGIDDIKNHIIKTPCDPNITFDDDPLRQMRVIRFSARYNWNIEKKTLDGIIKNAYRIKTISKERIADELEKILICDHPVKGLKLLQMTGLLHEIIPEFDDLINMSQNKYHFGSVWEHTLAVVENTQPKLKNRLAGLLHDIGKLKTRTIDKDGNVHFYKHELIGKHIAYDILKRLKFSNDIIDDVVFAIGEHMRTKQFGDEKIIVSDKAIRKLQADLGDRIDLVLDVINGDNLGHSSEYNKQFQIINIKNKIKELEESGMAYSNVKLPINGNDILRIKNISPGPLVKELLEKVKDLYLDNPKITYDECVNFIKNTKI